MAANRREGKFPTHWLVVNSQNVFCYSTAEYEKVLTEQDDTVVEDDELNGNGNGNGDSAAVQRFQKRAELHEVRDIEQIFRKLGDDMTVDDYLARREEFVTGEKAPARYVLVNEDGEAELDNVADIAPGVRRIGSKGIETKRFKGLGEMNAEELWETTMDPERRVLLRVRAEEAEEAERMFSLLMGDDVERRRNFIEEHALEVKNLDV